MQERDVKLIAGASDPAEISDDNFVGLLSANQIRLRAYLVAMVRNSSDIDDLIQETNLALWKSRERFSPERPFFPWACGVAYREVARFRRSRARDRLWFDETLLKTLSDDFVRQVDLQDQRHEALGPCLEKLSASDRSLLESRFRGGKSVRQLADEAQRPEKTIYWILSEVRKKLYVCIEKSLRQKSHPQVS